MAPPNQAIPEALYRNALNLNRFSNSVSNELINRYNDIILDISYQLASIDDVTSPGTALRLRTILAQLQESLGSWAIDSSKVTINQLQGLVVLETDFIQEQLKKLLPSNAAKRSVRTVEVSSNFAKSVVTTDPTEINVFTLPSELRATVTGIEPKFNLTARDGAVITLPNGATVQKTFRGLAKQQSDLFTKTVRNGLLIGETTDQISRRLRGKLQFNQKGTVRQKIAAGGEATRIANNQVHTIVRTSVNQVANAASRSVYAANKDITKQYKYVATLDNRTSSICARLDGQIFEYGKGPTPPQHFNCRSVIVAVIDNEFLDEFGISRDDLEIGTRPSKTGLKQIGQLVPANQTYPEWLSNQPIDLQEEVFGKKRSALFRKQIRKGKSPTQVFRQFVREDGSELTLKELEKFTKNS